MNEDDLKKDTIEALKQFLEMPNDTITMKVAIRTMKQLATLLLEQVNEAND